MPRDTVVAGTVNASGITWSQFKTGSWQAALDLLGTQNPARANPTTQATATATGGGASGGSLPAGDYYIAYTGCDPFGETLAGGRSAKLTVSAGNIPRVTLPSLASGIACWNLYLTRTNGAAGTEFLYATGITGATFDCSYALATDPRGGLPAQNTTGLVYHQALLRSLARPNGSVFQTKITGAYHNLVSAYGVDRRQLFHDARVAAGITKAWSVLTAEIYALAVANQGTLTEVVTSGVGMPVLTNVLP